MKIGELSAASSTPIETIRYMSGKACCHCRRARGGNFRIYEPPHLERLHHPSLPQPGHVAGRGACCCASGTILPATGDVNALLDEHIGHVSKRVKELRSLERQPASFAFAVARYEPPSSAASWPVLQRQRRARRSDKEHSHLRSVHGYQPSGPRRLHRLARAGGSGDSSNLKMTLTQPAPRKENSPGEPASWNGEPLSSQLIRRQLRGKSWAIARATG